MYPAGMQTVSYKRHRYPPQIIAHAVWLYFRFPLSLRLVEELLAERGITVSYETIRCWAKVRATRCPALEAETTKPKRYLASGRGCHQYRRKEALAHARGRSGRLCPRRDRSVPAQHQGSTAPADPIAAETGHEAEADHHRQTALLWSGAPTGHAQRRASIPQGFEQSS